MCEVRWLFSFLSFEEKRKGKGKENLKRRELSGRSGLFEKLRGRMQEIGPAAQVFVGHGAIQRHRVREEKGFSS